jgi:dTDP-4-amino-4,6-dideoxygalactose transaminase
MVQSLAKARLTLSQGVGLVCILFLLLLTPLVLSNHPAGAALSGLILIVIFFFPGYVLLGAGGMLPTGLRFLLSPIIGIVCLTTAYDVFARAALGVVFADIRPDTLNLDETRLESLITPQTKAIIVVHYAGVSCAMEAILSIAARHGVRVIEDNAHGIFSRYQGRYTGTFGCLATQSFHETKNFTCGEGGALVVNDTDLLERALVIREKGTNRNRFFRGEVDKYTWVDLGSSYLPSDLLAAFLYAQLEARESIQERRRRVWNHYFESLSEWAENNDVRLPVIPKDCEQAYHMFYMLLPSSAIRASLITHLKAQSVLSVFHYTPLHLSEAGRKFAARASNCPVTEDISDRLLRLPFYNDLTELEQDRVIGTVMNYRAHSLSHVAMQ